MRNFLNLCFSFNSVKKKLSTAKLPSSSSSQTACSSEGKKENFYSPTLVLMSERTTSIFMGLLSLFSCILSSQFHFSGRHFRSLFLLNLFQHSSQYWVHKFYRTLSCLWVNENIFRNEKFCLITFWSESENLWKL